MSTRKGNVVFMDDLIYEAEELALQILKERKKEIEKTQAIKIAKEIWHKFYRQNPLDKDVPKEISFHYLSEQYFAFETMKVENTKHRHFILKMLRRVLHGLLAMSQVIFIRVWVTLPPLNLNKKWRN